MSLEILKGNMELNYNYLQIMNKTNLYYRLGLGTLTVGLIGLISFWKEFKN
jgi:hypothetical protein